LFIPCGGLSWLPFSFLLHVKCTLSYRIVSYRTTLESTHKVQTSASYYNAHIHVCC